MLEVEVKAFAHDVEGLRGRLREAGAERVGRERQHDLYFRHPGRDFRASDEALRLRFRLAPGQEPEACARAELTYKGPKLDLATKSRVEASTFVDPRSAVRILEGLGFAKQAVVRKVRESWRLRGFTVCVDEVEGLGTFAEVEREVDAEPSSSEFARARDGALELLHELGLGGSERRSYLELLEAEGKLHASRPHRGAP